MKRQTCGHPGCTRLANIVYRSLSHHPIPRCFDHAPPLHEGVRRGWLDPPSVTP